MSDTAAQMGVCRFCGCSEDKPCKLRDGETCGWVTPLRTVCTKLSCMYRWESEAKRVASDRKRLIRDMRRAYWPGLQAKRLAVKQGRKPGKGRAA